MGIPCCGVVHSSLIIGKVTSSLPLTDGKLRHVLIAPTHHWEGQIATAALRTDYIKLGSALKDSTCLPSSLVTLFWTFRQSCTYDDHLMRIFTIVVIFFTHDCGHHMYKLMVCKSRTGTVCTPYTAYVRFGDRSAVERSSGRVCYICSVRVIILLPT
jgi:hypothetical protein